MLHAFLGLFRLGLSTRFRIGGSYWKWRKETAFGNDPAKWPSEAARRHAMLEYAAWAHRMRRFLE